MSPKSSTFFLDLSPIAVGNSWNPVGHLPTYPDFSAKPGGALTLTNFPKSTYPDKPGGALTLTTYPDSTYPGKPGGALTLTQLTLTQLTLTPTYRGFFEDGNLLTLTL